MRYHDVKHTYPHHHAYMFVAFVDSLEVFPFNEDLVEGFASDNAGDAVFATGNAGDKVASTLTFASR